MIQSEQLIVSSGVNAINFFEGKLDLSNVKKVKSLFWCLNLHKMQHNAIFKYTQVYS